MTLTTQDKDNENENDCTKQNNNNNNNDDDDDDNNDDDDANNHHPKKSLRHALGLPPTADKKGRRKFPEIVGHRGSLHQHVENTRPSFQKCWDLYQKYNNNNHKKNETNDNYNDNVDDDDDDDDDNQVKIAIELDVYVIQDGNVIVFHGNDRDDSEDNDGMIVGSIRGQFRHLRNMPTTAMYSSSAKTTSNTTTTTSRRLSILEYTYDEIQPWSFDPEYPEFAAAGPPPDIHTAQIPLLRDVLKDFQQSCLQQEQESPQERQRQRQRQQRQQQQQQQKPSSSSASKTTTTDNSNNTTTPASFRPILIELKGPGTVRPVLEIVEALQLQSYCRYSSFDHDRLLELRQLRPSPEDYPTAALFGSNTGSIVGYPTPDYLQTYCQSVLQVSELHVPYDWCHVKRMTQYHDWGFRTMAWMRGPAGMQSDLQTKYSITEYEYDDEYEYEYDDDPQNNVEREDTNDDNNNNNNDNAKNRIIMDEVAFYPTLMETGVQQLCINKPDRAVALLLQKTNSSITTTRTRTTPPISNVLLTLRQKRRVPFLKNIPPE